MRRATLLLGAVALAVPASAATVCVNPAGTGLCKKTIQDAVTAANPGDTVLVGVGTYYENVTVGIGKVGLRIQGASKLSTILDPSPNSATGVANVGPGIVIGAPGVTVSNLTIRNGQDNAIAVKANNALVQFVRFLSTGVNANGVDVSVGYSGTRILNNEFRSVSASAVAAQGSNSGTIVKFNLGYGGGDDMFTVSGDSSVVSNNKAYDCYGTCFIVVGASPVVQFNTTQNAGEGGFFVAGAGALVTNNAIRDAAGDGISVSGDGAVVRNNVLTNVGGDGIYVTANTATVSFNTVTNAPNGFGVSVSGAASVVASNRVTHSGDGIHVSGASASVTANTVTDADGDGVDVSGTNPTVDRNRTSDTQGTGVSVSCAPSCTAASVAYNVVSNAYGPLATGFYLGSDAAGIVAQRNTVTKSHQQSYYLDGTGHVLRYNVAQDQSSTGADLGCYYVGGTGSHTLELNTATRCSEAGFYVLTGSNTLNNNTASYTYRNGFEVHGGSNLLGANKATFSVGAGFAVVSGASSTTLTGNLGGLGNRTDYCDDGTSTAATANSFATTAPSCDIF